MNRKESALDQIAILAAAHGITADEIAARLATRSDQPRRGTLVAQLFGYLGGAFVFSGTGLLISFIWNDVSSAQRVILTFGTGLVAFVLAIVCARDPRFERASTPLFLVSASLQPFGLFVFLDEYLPPTGNATLAAMAVFGTLALQHGLIFASLKRSSVLFLGLAFVMLFLGAALEHVDVDEDVTAAVLGSVALGMATVVARTPWVTIVPFWYFVGGGLLLGGWWAIFEDTIFDFSTLGLSVALVALSIRAASRTLLFVSVVGLLAYLSYFAYEYFADVIGWPITLIGLGLLMIGVGGWAMKLGRTIQAPSPSS